MATPTFHERSFLEVEPAAGRGRQFLRELADRFPPRLEALRPELPALVKRLQAEPEFYRWVGAPLLNEQLNLCGAWINRLMPASLERMLHLLFLGRILSPGIETLASAPQPAPVAVSQPLVSIIIVAWNNWEDTCDCIGSLFAHLPDTSFEIVVVDNGSTDDTVTNLPLLATKCRLLRVVRSEENLGFSGGNNLGVQAARGRHLCFLNNDTLILDASWLGRLVETLESDARIGAVGKFGVVDLEDDLPAPNAFYQRIFLPGLVVPVAWLSGFCLLVRREALAAACGWRQDLYGIAGYEDIHLGYALCAAGWISVVPARRVAVYHKIGRTRFKEENAVTIHRADITAEEKERRFRAHFGDRRLRPNYALPDR